MQPEDDVEYPNVCSLIAAGDAKSSAKSSGPSLKMEGLTPKMFLSATSPSVHAFAWTKGS